MIDKIYQLLNNMGYAHPLHPALTHAPVGAVIIAFCLMAVGLLWRRPNLFSSAYHALTVGFVLLIPTVILGILDWQHYYAGAWVFPIQMKVALASLLFILLSITLIVGRNSKVHPATMMCLCTFCLFNVMGLGFFGGELVFADRKLGVTKDFQAGQNVFLNHCAGCHINGGNVFFPNMPLRSAPQLKSFETFLAFVRNPTLRNGKKGPMPNFTSGKLSDQQVRELHGYIVNKLAKPESSE
jgi:uncharacterized membrane protein